jgi:predicted negative regulator of RcsB-dependent stress response
MRPVQTLFLPLILLVLPTAQADTIHLTDGTSIEGVSIKEETLQGVVYKDGRTDATVQSNLIRSITFSPMPVLIDRAEAGLDEDQYMGSVAGYEEYIAQTSSPERKFPWALNYAYFRVIELQQTMGKYDAVVAAADRLIEKAGTSRYAPLALVKKAEALFDGGKAKEALVALDALTQMSKSAQLGERWDIEADLRRVLFDARLQGQARIKKLEAISSRAGGMYQSVWGRAEVAIGEALLKNNDQAEAEKVFRSVLKETGSDRNAMAAAWSGVGACLFNRAAAATEAGEDGAPAICRDSALAHMRVLVLYRDQTRYLSGALYWAGRSFDLIGDEESSDRAQRLYRKVISNHKGSRWAEEARAFYKKR